MPGVMSRTTEDRKIYVCSATSDRLTVAPWSSVLRKILRQRLGSTEGVMVGQHRLRRRLPVAHTALCKAHLESLSCFPPTTALLRGK